jgi:FAD:protein FMN transferase
MNSALSKLRRRDFLKLAAVGGLAFSVPFVASRLKTNISSNAEVTSFSSSFNAIGTIVSVFIDDAITTSEGNELVTSLTKQINTLEDVLTRFPGGTDLCTLNQTGDIEAPSSTLIAVLEDAMNNSVQSGGSFDVTVKPVLDLLQGYLEGQPFPTDSQFDAAKALIDYENVDLSNSQISLNKAGMGITLDGIATGYILDQSIALFRSNGIKSALINFGGTLATVGTRSDGSLWKVGIIDPLNPTSTIGNLYLRDQAVATSGDYEDYYTPNKQYYHIIDPFTARSPLYSHSATVVASTSNVADPLGVSLMVEDPNDAMRLIDSYPAECLIYTDSSGITTSSGMKELMNP